MLQRPAKFLTLPREPLSSRPFCRLVPLLVGVEGKQKERYHFGAGAHAGLSWMCFVQARLVLLQIHKRQDFLWVGSCIAQAD